MDFSIATLLSHFIDDKLVAAKVLEKKLGCEDENSKDKLQIALEALEKVGVLVKDRGKYRRVYDSDAVEAKLRCSSKGFCFAIQDDEDADDIYIRESHLSNAWNGDRVLVKIIKEGTRRRSPEGEVKVILDRANPSLLATVKAENEDYRAVPLDDRLLFELDLRQNGGNLAEAIDHLVHVSVLRYPIGQYRPLGKVTRVLGSDAEEAADTDIVCCKHDLPHDFPDSVSKLTRKIATTITSSEKKQRRDLTKLLTVTLVPESTPEQFQLVENAFSLEKTKAGDWSLGIHWLDVAHYITPDSELDKIARGRGTAVYLGDRILPLFPEEVLKQISLVPEAQHRCFSIFMTLNAKGELVEFEAFPSLIAVDRQFSYEQIQSLLSKQEKIPKDIAAAVAMLEQLFFTVCPLIKAQRIQRGSFEIPLAESQCPYKDEGRMGAITTSSSLPVRSLLTELVVLAGHLLATHLTALEIPGIYCTQPEPDYEELEDLIKLGNNLGLEIVLESEEAIAPTDYQNLSSQFSKTPVAKVLHYLLHATLKPIKYNTHPGFHFGLAYPNYTHFSSPAQRYADLLVQRILQAVFTYGRDRRHSRAKTGVNLGSSTCHGKINWKVLPPDLQGELETEIITIIHHLNEREKIAEDAEEDLQGLKKAEKMKERTGQIFQGLITGVQSYGFFVEIEDWLVEGLVHVSSLKDDWYEYRARHSCLVGRKNRVAYRLGDTVEVEVKSVDYYRQQIDLVTVRGGSALQDEDLEED